MKLVSFVLKHVVIMKIEMWRVKAYDIEGGEFYSPNKNKTNSGKLMSTSDKNALFEMKPVH